MDEEEVVWENERWGIDPLTRTARFGGEFLLLGERAQYVSSSRPVLAAIFLACSSKNTESGKRSVDDAFWDGAALEPGFEWTGKWVVDNTLSPRLEGAEWLHGVNFARDAANLQPKVLPHHFVRTRRWRRPRKKKLGVAPVVEEPEDYSEALLRLRGFAERRERVRGRAHIRVLKTLAIACFLFSCFLTKRITVVLGYFLALALTAITPQRWDFFVYLVRPLLWCVNWVGRSVLESRLTDLLGARCFVAAFSIDVDKEHVTVRCGELVVLDPTLREGSKPMVRCASASVRCGWRAFVEACLSTRQNYVELRVEGLEVRLESVSTLKIGKGETVSRLNLDFAARPGEWLYTTEKEVFEVKIHPLVLGALGKSVSARASEVLQESAGAAERLSELNFVPAWLKRRNRGEVRYSIGKVVFQGPSMAMGSSVIEGVSGEDETLRRNVAGFFRFWGEEARLEFGDLSLSSAETREFQKEALHFAEEGCTGGELCRHMGSLLYRASQNALVELLVVAPMRQGHLNPESTMERLRGLSLDEDALLAMVPESFLEALKVERKTAHDLAKALQPVAHLFFNTEQNTSAFKLDRKSALGEALESVGVDTEALARNSNLETARMSFVQSSRRLLNDDEPHSLAADCIRTLRPLLVRAREALVERWRDDSEALSALTALDASLFELDDMGRDALASLAEEEHGAKLFDVEKVMEACAKVADLSYMLERYVTPELLSELAKNLADHADHHLLSLLADRGAELFFTTFSHLPTGAFKGAIAHNILGALTYTVRNIELGAVPINSSNLELTLGTALSPVSAISSRHLLGDREVEEEEQEESVSTARECDAPTETCSLTIDLFRIDLRDVEAPLKNLKWAFTQESFPYASDSGSADATLHGLSVCIEIAAKRRTEPPFSPFLCVTTVRIDIERIELFVGEAAMSRLYNVVASALATPLRDYVTEHLEAALRSEFDGRLKRIDDYLDANNLWPLLLALAKIKNPNAFEEESPFVSPLVSRTTTTSTPAEKKIDNDENFEDGHLS